MIVFRISHSKYADKLQSSGMPNRWNTAGQQVIYTSESISLCALELLAHTSGIKPAGSFSIMHIALVKPVKLLTVVPAQLPKNWQKLSAYAMTQNLGSNWYDTMNELCLKVPSAVVPSEHNIVINTRHPDFTSNVKLLKTEDFFWDDRFPSR